MQDQISALQRILDKVIEFLVNYSFQAVGAIIVLIVGVVLSNWTSRALLALFAKRHLDITVSKFLAGCARFTVLGFAVVVALGNFGITMAPFIAALGGLAFGTSFALQGPLSNYGAGLSIILARPFVVGDTITVAGVSGVVEDVKLAATTLVNEDNIRITIPNKHIVGEILHNSKQHRIVEGVVGIAYSSDPDLAIRLVRETLAGSPDVVHEPQPQIGVEQFADSSVNIRYRYWVPTLKYFQTLYAVNLRIYRAFQKSGVDIPFPQRDIHVIAEANGGPAAALARPERKGGAA
jgi:small conductance mechanosensitive channel